MVLYPVFAAALEGRDLIDLAIVSAVPTDTIRAILDGGLAPSQGLRMKLARALHANPIDLFVCDPAVEEALSGAPSRYVTDPDALRTIDGARQ